MTRARRRFDPTAAVLLSVAAHVVVLTALALHAPMLVRPREEAGPPEPVIPVLIMPRTPPPPPGSREPPRPIRLHRRQLRRGAEPPPIPPLTAERLPVPSSATGRAAAKPPRVTVQPSPAAQLSATLRRSAVGCATPDLLGPEERAACEERLGRGVREAPALPPAFSPSAQRELGRAAAAKEAYRNYKRAPTPPGGGPAGGDSGQPWSADLPPLPAPPRMRP
jgi:hypothetical protein